MGRATVGRTTLSTQVRPHRFRHAREAALALDARLPAADAPALGRFERAVNFCACLAWHFSEIDAEMQFATQGFERGMQRASEVVYAALEALALVRPLLGAPASSDLLSQIGNDGRGFHIILTSQPRGSIPAHLWGTSYFVFFESL